MSLKGKRFLISIGITCVLCASMSINIFASTNDEASSSIYEKAHKAPHSVKVETLVKEGLSEENAEYYATLEDKCLNLEENKQIIDISDATLISDDTVASDPRGFKNKLLKLDHSALATSIYSMKRNLSDNSNNIENLKKQNPAQSNYCIQFPDGSSISATLEVDSNKTSSDNNYNSNVVPQGYSEEVFDQTYVSQGTHTYPEWSVKFTGTASWVRTAVINANFTVLSNKSTMNSFTVGAAASGIIHVDANYPYTIKNGYNTTSYAQAQSSCLFSTNAAFTGSCGFLSFSINTGVQCTIYADLRVFGNSLRQTVAAYYD